MKFLAALGALLFLAYFAVVVMVICAIGYAAYEILFTDALNRWFG